MTRCKVGFLIFVVVVGLVQAAGCGKQPSAPGTSAADAKTADSATAVGKSSAAPASSGFLTVQEVLEKMAAAYRSASSYEDLATAELWEPGRKEPRRADFRVAFQRPSKLRMEFYQGRVVCDGKKWLAFSNDIPGQAVLRDAPEKIKLQMLQADPVLNQVLNSGFAGGSPQLLLLLAEKPLAMLLDGVRDQDLTLDQPERIGDDDCYRVLFKRNDGQGEYWIDQKTFVLRRMSFRQSPTPPSREGEAAAGSVTIVASFERARLGGAIDPAAFQVKVPEGAECRRALVDPGPYELIGKKLPDFQIADTQGKPWNSRTLAGKVVALHLWRSNAEACLPVIPSLQQAYDKFKDNEKVAVWAINLDSAEVETKTIEETAKQWKLSVPVLRDPELETPKLLRISALPATFFLDAKGVLQDCIVGDSPLAAAATARKLASLLAGEELAAQALEKFQQRVKQEEKEVDLQFSGEAVTTTVQQIKPTPAAAKRAPAKLRLKPLWHCTAVRPGGNILVVEEPGGPSLILVVDGFHAVCKLDAKNGKLIANYQPPKMADVEFFINLRTGAQRDGKRYFAAFAPTQQRFHLFDEKLNHVLSYPADALENPHAGLGDVALGDLDGDGVLKGYVGFAGVVGVKCISLQGMLIRPCRSLFNISRVLPGPADAQAHRQLYCVSDFNSLAVLDAKLQLQAATRIPGGVLHALLHADLTGSGSENWCGVVFAPDPQQTNCKFTAVGLNANKGEVTWEYALPSGTQLPVEPIVVGRLLPGPARQWLLPGCDGSVHVLAADGTLIDRFNYGEQINGLATLEIDGKPALLISSAGGVEALRVEL